MQQLGDQFSGAGGVFGGFHHRAVACRQGTHQGVERELEGVVPGPDDQHATQGLLLHPGAAGLQGQVEGDRPRRHPAPQVPAGERDLLANGHHLEGGFQGGLAQIGGQGFEHRRFVLLEQGLKPSQLLQAPTPWPRVAPLHRGSHGRRIG